MNLTLPPKEDPNRPGMCAICHGPLGADHRNPRSLGLCDGVGCHDRCKGCGHERMEHSPDRCLHVGPCHCVCVLPITDVPYGTHSREHYDYTGGVK